jgi:hypothetical protein
MLSVRVWTGGRTERVRFIDWLETETHDTPKYRNPNPPGGLIDHPKPKRPIPETGKAKGE